MNHIFWINLAETLWNSSCFLLLKAALTIGFVFLLCAFFWVGNPCSFLLLKY